MTHAQAIWAKGHDWFVKITCPEVGVYIVHAQSWAVDICIHEFKDYAEMRAWAGY